MVQTPNGFAIASEKVIAFAVESIATPWTEKIYEMWRTAHSNSLREAWEVYACNLVVGVAVKRRRSVPKLIRLIEIHIRQFRILRTDHTKVFSGAHRGEFFADFVECQVQRRQSGILAGGSQHGRRKYVN